MGYAPHFVGLPAFCQSEAVVLISETCWLIFRYLESCTRFEPTLASFPVPRLLPSCARLLIPALLVFGGQARAAGLPSAAVTLQNIFQPQAAPLLALAPDGRHLAYTRNEITDAGSVWSIVLVDLATRHETEVPIREIPRIYGGVADGGRGSSALRVPPIRISYLQWSSPDLLAYFDGWAVRVMDAAGQHDRRVADGYDLGAAVAARGIISRPIRIENLLPDNPGTLVVSAWAHVSLPVGGGPPLEPDLADTYLLDLAASKWKALGQFKDDGTYVRDLQGRPRINLTNPIVPSLGAGPFLDPAGIRFSYREAQAKEISSLFGLHHWDKWEDVVGKESGLSFNYHADDLYRARAQPLGFGQDPDVLYYASNTDRDTQAIYALNLRNKKSALVLAEPTVDLAQPQQAISKQGLVFDRTGNLAGIRVNAMKPHTVWLDPKVATFQARIDERFPRYNAEITEWDSTYARFLVSVSSLTDPGGIWVADANDLAQPIFTLGRTLQPAVPLNPAMVFAFDSPAGVHLTGTITRPLAARVSPPPAVIYCHPLPGRATGGFNRVTQALATLGFVVIDVNYRGSNGLGTALRDGFRENPDGPVEDILATLDWVKSRYPIDPKRVALYGVDLGGYFALRTLEEHAELFRAGVAYRAPASISNWISAGPALVNPRRALLGTDDARYRTQTLKEHAADLMRPVMLISSSVPENLAAKFLAFTLKNDLIEPEVLTSTGYRDPDDPGLTDVEMYLRIGTFLNDTFFNYESSIGELKVLE